MTDLTVQLAQQLLAVDADVDASSGDIIDLGRSLAFAVMNANKMPAMTPEVQERLEAINDALASAMSDYGVEDEKLDDAAHAAYSCMFEADA